MQARAMGGVMGRWMQRPVRLPAVSQETLEEEAAQKRSTMALARELLHAVEQFVISTPDLDTRRFLNRISNTAAGLSEEADAASIAEYREWAQSALGAFAQLQKRYVSEREEEMWRLLDLHQQAIERSHTRDEALVQSIEQSHQRLRRLSSLDDIREARLEIEEEIRQAKSLVDLKVREDRERNQALARQIARLESALAAVRGRARFDALTRLYHRGALMDSLREVLKMGQPCSLAVLDVDNFKTINSSLGHAVGDRLLVMVAEQLSRVARTTDVPARWGGDEFCFLAPGLNGEQLAQRLAGAVARRHVRMQTGERHYSVLLSMSVGIAAWNTHDPPETLIYNADKALLAVKRSGKGGVRIGH